MPIDFFKKSCKTVSTNKNFGLYDNPRPATDPAFIVEIDSSKWIAEVEKVLDNETVVDFFAIDHCLDIYRPNNELAKRCDGVLVYNNNLTFVELKDRGSSGWVSSGRKQLTETIQFFIANHNIATYTNAVAYICNKQQEEFYSYPNTAIEVQKLKDDTGLRLIIERKIII